ncbi:hypothetical protein [Pseudomonas sp. dw_358]|uniref:hypothetical protein n=1 Tax=Pseudomonas sp. dw_358 TaxID=2720083 RepID=UPI001BD35272|nr:hypothetical protein [Pseudomonas sp. dw_358]
MPEIKHTPGPWVVEVDTWGTTSVKSANEEDLQEWPIEYFLAEKIGGHIYGEDFGDFSEVQANAKLIAAAPDLLAALKQAHMALIGYLPQHRNEITSAAIRSAVTAIDKATE